MCIGMCIDMYIIGMCIDVCIGMCIGMCVGICMGMYRCVYRHVHGVGTGVCIDEHYCLDERLDAVVTAMQMTGWTVDNGLLTADC